MRKKKIPKPRWTGFQIVMLRKLYATHSNKDIASRIGRKENSVTYKAFLLGLEKSKKRLSSMGKENIAKRWNKAKKGKSK